MSVLEEREGIDEKLCILVKVKDSVCALQSVYVESLFLMEQDVIQLPCNDEIHIGVIQYRGSVLPLVDLRGMMGMESHAQEEHAFEEMLDMRKQDHIHWVEELKRCIAEEAPFTLATDPHKCTFGKWYYNFKPSNHSVDFHLRKIEEPHAKLHQTADEALACSRKCDECEREECLQVALKRGTEEYMPRVLELIDEVKAVFRDNSRRMVMVVSDGENRCGVLVDEVTSVEPVNSVEDYGQTDSYGRAQLIVGIARRNGDDEDMILMLNGQKILRSRSA